MYIEKLININRKLRSSLYEKMVDYKYIVASVIVGLVGLNLFAPQILQTLDNMIDASESIAQESKMSLREIYDFEKSRGYDVIIDVRTKEEYDAGHVEDTINIPHTDILENPNLLEARGITKNKMVLVYCRSGRRASLVVNEMLLAGYDKNSVHYSSADYTELSKLFL